MSLAFINSLPFLMAILYALPFFRQVVPKTAKAWLAAGAMLLLFLSLLNYYPQVQALDNAYKEQKGLSLAEHGTENNEPLTSPTEEQPAEFAESAKSDRAVIERFEWLPELGLTISFYLDGLALLFALIITGVGTLIFLYAGYYFDESDEQVRFITVLFAFTGAMLGLVLSGNLLTLFVMWELTSITSFLLIGFKGAKYEEARFGASQAFMVTGVGALALIAGFVLLALMSGEVLQGGGFNFDLATILTTDAQTIATHPLYTATLLLVALGAFTKSAQFPFHFWLPGAMAAPTPASAYLHSATMVKAGVYLLLRLYPVLSANELWTSLLVSVGIGTMFIAAVIALFQRDLKGLLAYSTVSWLGALVGMIGLPDAAGIKAALVGILAHALYKAALFLAAGTIDHNTGTRHIDELGGLARKMPVIAFVVLVSGLSMAGVPIFFGFVAKEVLLDVWFAAPFTGQSIAYGFILISAALTGTAALIFIWDVFIKPLPESAHWHYHESSPFLLVAPVILAIGTISFGFFLDGQWAGVEGLIALGVPKAINIHLLPSSITNPVFLTSMAIVAAGIAVFTVRSRWLPVLAKMPVPRATDLYQALLTNLDKLADFALTSQRGEIRYYLLVILGVFSSFILFTGIVSDFASGQLPTWDWDEIISSDFLLRTILFGLMILSAAFTVRFRRHIYAALSLGVLGYTIGTVFLIEPAPDVSMVQFLMETLGTILLIIMLGRISRVQLDEVTKIVFRGRSDLRVLSFGRDVLVAGMVGIAVFFFAYTALSNRPERESITQYHLDHTYEEIGVEDVVGAIVADWRGMDTVIEGTVFAVAALGVLTLLTRGLDQFNPFVAARENVKYFTGEFSSSFLKLILDNRSMDTAFTRMIARIALPITFLIAISQIVTGSFGPGDGFTAGAMSGLVIALWFVVFGFDAAKTHLQIFPAHRMLRLGLAMIIINASLPIFLSNIHSSTFTAHVNYGKLLGISDFLARFGLELSTGLFFELGIAFTVFGGIVLIMEAIAHPEETKFVDFDTDNHGAVS